MLSSNVKLCSFAWLLLLIVGAGCQTSPATPPNIVLINIDDMGWRDVGFMGSEYYDTPILDNLASKSMVFTDGYAAAANCAPSRATLLTGLWTTRHEIYTVGPSERGDSKDRKIIPTKNTTILDREFTTVAEVLSSEGYATCHAGKWHLSRDPKPYGFDLSIGGAHNGHPRSYYPPYGNVPLTPPGDEYLTDYIMTRTLDFVDSVRRPFFLYYSPYAVHTPIQPVPSLLAKYGEQEPWNGQDNPDYATMVENLDRNIGRLLSLLEKQGRMDNTLIIFTSDNGGLFGITRQWPLRAGKGSYYEGGIRVPYFFYWKDRIASGNNSTPISHLDLFPTLVEAVVADAPAMDLDGQSLLPILEGTASLQERALFWHFPIYLQAYNPKTNENRDLLFRTRPGSVVRQGPWKLHYYFEEDEIELYHLSADIGEKNDLSDAEPEKRDELLSKLRSWWEQTDAPLPKVTNPEYTAIDK